MKHAERAIGPDHWLVMLGAPLAGWRRSPGNVEHQRDNNLLIAPPMRQEGHQSPPLLLQRTEINSR